MRTTLDLDDHAYAMAKAVAHERNIGLGRAISEIIIRYMQPSADPPPLRVRMENGLPVVSIGRVITTEEVRKVLDESE